MKRRRKRCIVELAVGFLAMAIVSTLLLFSRYETYLENLAVAARIVSSDDPEIEGFEILKEDPEMTKEEVKDVLKKYGYETVASSREGKMFIKYSILILCSTLILYLVYGSVILFEYYRKKQDTKEESKEVAESLVKIREGSYFRERNLDEEWDESKNLIQGELDSLGSYVEMIKDQAHREKEETKTLVTDISHQLKTPVAALNSCFEILKSQNLTEEERKEFEGRLEAQLRSLGQLIEALVNISRLETGMIELNCRKASIFDTILEAVNRIWVKAQKKGIEIELEGEDKIDGLIIRHDPKWLCEALINVLDNAVKYSENGTKVTICVFRMVSFLRLEIHDQGVGICKENYHKVFRRFYRGQESEVQKEEGSGVGLYLVRKIVEGHHGTISLDGAKMKKKKGSVFVIQIPYE